MERIELTPGYSISRVIKGGWHLAGGHGTIDATQAIEDMHQFVKAGITTFDCADIYTGVEELIGRFLKKYQPAFAVGDLPPVQIHTKYVPDYNLLSGLKKSDTREIIERSLKRLGVERLDLVQFHWWDYQFPGYVEAAQDLQTLKEEGKIRHVSVTNFDAVHLKEIVEAGVEITTNQVQYSVMDQRPAHDLEAFCEEHDISLLCYGTVAGGFLSDRYLGAPDPTAPLENRSLVKYRLIIDEFGGYERFQALLQWLRGIAEKYEVGIAEVASRYILQKPRVAGVIIGARNANHLKRLTALSHFQLDERDLARLNDFIQSGPKPEGAVYTLERDKEGKHGSIMKYNLNEEKH